MTGGAEAIPGGTPAEAMRVAEARLAWSRERAPDVPGALAEAAASACGEAGLCHPAFRPAAAIAREVQSFGAAFPPGEEPPYHDRHHQAEATLAMGWLCGRALEAGALDLDSAMLGIAGMVAHDLHHPGRPATRPRGHEERSAATAVALAAREGAGEAWCEALRGVILATAMPQPPETEPVPLLHRLAHEADVFASALPRLGRRLSALMAEELRRAGVPGASAAASHAGRHAFLSAIGRPTGPAVSLGLAATLACQHEAYRRCALSLGAGDSAAAGAAALDSSPPQVAEALFSAALAEASHQI